jgi:cytochrome c peroxidase
MMRVTYRGASSETGHKVRFLCFLCNDEENRDVIKKFAALLVVLVATLVLVFSVATAEDELLPIEQLGKALYFDENLSEPAGQSCASCHEPAFGFVDPDADLPVSEGVIPGLFGGRISPASAYAMYAPIRFIDDEGLYVGGQFWDSRAAGVGPGSLEDPLADQALGPFLNPVEMANTSKAQVIADIAISEYAGLFEEVWGTGALGDVETAYDQVALSIAEFERTELFGQFSSKFDHYLGKCLAMGGDMADCAVGAGKIADKAGKKYFSKEEWYGLQLFMGENNNDGILEKGEGAMCAACHIAEWTAAADYDLPVVVPAWAPPGMVPPLFTDFTYDNLGVPQNFEFPLDTVTTVDLGLGPIVGDTDENGKFKVMTLRNIGLTAPYAHNGLFKRLKEITHFYNTRDVPGALKKGADWPAPEYPATKNDTELGNLGLSDDDEDAIVEFMKTLSDGWTP